MYISLLAISIKRTSKTQFIIQICTNLLQIYKFNYIVGSGTYPS